MSGLIDLRYRPGGKVLARFLASVAPVEGIMGPIGSGKTQCCVIKLVNFGRRQKPSSRDGIRKFRVIVVRDTYRQLWNTTIPSWWKRLPKDAGEWVGALGDPATHRLIFRLEDDSVCEFEANFVAIGDNAVEDVLRGYEPTAIWLNEADRLARDVFTYSKSRVGRYPEMSEGGPSWYGVLADFNAPDTENWTYETFVERPSADTEFFAQPSALSAEAENLDNLPPDYYERQIEGQPEWFIRRMVRNEFGYSREGKPVYPEYSDRRHIGPRGMKPVRGLPLQLGADAGGTPAAVLGQRLAGGQWRIYAELCMDGGATRFGEALNQLLAEPEFAEIGISREGPGIIAYCDPAAFSAGTDEKSWAEIVEGVTKIRFRAAASNKPTIRQEAVRVPLLRSIDGDTPGFLLHPRCAVLRKGFNSGYRYRRLNLPGGERYHEAPEKNEYSHPHDALQYLMLGGGEYMAVRGRAQAERGRLRQTQAIDADHPQGEYTGDSRRQAYAVGE